MAWRELEEQVIHDRVVTALKKSIFNYPSDKHPNLKTHPNHPIKTHSVTDHLGGQFYPDLVVLDSRSEKVVSVVEVETVSTVTESEAKQWFKFASLSENFYLFSPRGFEAKVRELCLKISNIHYYEYWQEENRFRVEHINLT
jgi:hypothetical protein